MSSRRECNNYAKSISRLNFPKYLSSWVVYIYRAQTLAFNLPQQLLTSSPRTNIDTTTPTFPPTIHTLSPLLSYYFRTTMAPPIPKFHVSELETQVNLQPSGKARKGPPIKLEECPLKEMVQYKCNISNPEKKKGDPPLIVCEPVVRFYRL